MKKTTILLFVLILLAISTYSYNTCNDIQYTYSPCSDIVKLTKNCDYVDIYYSNSSLYQNISMSYLSSTWFYSYELNFTEQDFYLLSFCDQETYAYVDVYENSSIIFTNTVDLTTDKPFYTNNDTIAIIYNINITTESISETNLTIYFPNGTEYFIGVFSPPNHIRGNLTFNNSDLSTLATGKWNATIVSYGSDNIYSDSVTFKVNTPFVNFPTCDNYTLNLMTYSPNFCDVNSSCIVYADTTDDSFEQNMSVVVSLDGITYPMDYIDNQWTLTLENNAIQDLPITYQSYKLNGSDMTCSNNKTETLKFRDAFEVTIELYKNGIVNNSNPRPYYSDFDYIYLVYTGTNPDTMIQQGRNSMRGVNNFIYTINRMIPQSKVFKSNRQFIGKNSLNTAPYYLWSKYNNGKATIKLYETGYYDIYTLNTKVQNNFIQYAEFQKPSRDDTVELDNKITTFNLNETQVLKIEANAIEYEGLSFWSNLIWSVIIIVVFLIIHALLFWLGDKIGLDGTLSVTLSFISVPIIFISLAIIWLGTITRLIF